MRTTLHPRTSKVEREPFTTHLLKREFTQVPRFDTRELEKEFNGLRILPALLLGRSYKHAVEKVTNMIALIASREPYGPAMLEATLIENI